MKKNLIETIKVQNRILQNIEFHNIRFNRSRKELFGIYNPLEAIMEKMAHET